MKAITVTELNEKLNNNELIHILDVREIHEYEEDNIGATLLPLSELRNMEADAIEDWKNEPIVIHCKSGMRSMEACMILTQLGFQDVANLTGGIMEWRKINGAQNLK